MQVALAEVLRDPHPTPERPVLNESVSDPHESTHARTHKPEAAARPPPEDVPQAAGVNQRVNHHQGGVT